MSHHLTQSNAAEIWRRWIGPHATMPPCAAAADTCTKPRCQRALFQRLFRRLLRRNWRGEPDARQSVLDHLAAARKSVDSVTIELVMESIGKTFERMERRATVI